MVIFNIPYICTYNIGTGELAMNKIQVILMWGVATPIILITSAINFSFAAFWMGILLLIGFFNSFVVS